MIHSEEYIEDSRFQWWNPDYLDLLIKRFALREAKSILEVGTGLGHWSRPLLKRIPTEWTFHGLDKERHRGTKNPRLFRQSLPLFPSFFFYRARRALSLPHTRRII